ncbi:PPOX class probable F420-dependent enzyme [Actinokineospora terrae]|uniref:PPOX class probable F420-dependent enzyme n=2 Tax=Actinokineospora terrae TaxID=155974 RepID=A0A1H9WHK2_9PSEU|nr:PPOX class probable F420-dependent enzyme [Actinokineospora terrae]
MVRMAGKGFDTESGLARVVALASTQDWLAVLVTQRADGEPATSVVNVGLVEHPVTGERVLALVSRGGTTKLRNLRRTPRATLVFRAGWDWIAVAGGVEIAGPDDAHEGVSAERLPSLLREIYTAAGGQHDDFEVYDREMAADRRAAVFVRPERFSANPVPHDRED